MDASALASAESWLSIIGWAKLLAAFLVALGVAMEFGGDWVSRPFEKTIEEERKLELSKLNAALVAGQQEVERLKTDNLELQKLVQPRRLSSTQQASITQALVPFRGRRVTIASYAFDVDGIVLAEQIELAIRNADLPRTSEIGARIPAHAPIVQGIRITGSDSALVEVLKKSLSLLGKLALDEKMYPLGDELLEFKAVPDEAAFIYVGTKPIADGATSDTAK